MSSSRPHVVIVGAGVIGLSTALALLDSPSPCTVTLVAASLPSDADHPASYASSWAGAHHVSCPNGARDAEWDKQTFRVLKALAKRSPQKTSKPWAMEEETKNGWLWDRQAVQCFGAIDVPPPLEPLCWVRQVELFANPPKTPAQKSAQDVLKGYPEYRQSSGLYPTDPVFQSTSSLPVDRAHHFSTLDINVPTYLSALYQRFKALGGRTIRTSVHSLAQALYISQFNLPASWLPPSAIVAAVGLGARHLAELCDGDVFPVRGQTVLVEAPWLKEPGAQGTSQRPNWPAMSRTNEEGERDLYIIPRGDGQFIVGGTRVVNDDDPSPRPETTKAILQRALQICPALIPPERRLAPGVALRAEDVRVLAVNVGLRPARKGGPLLEQGRDIDRPGGETARVILSYGYGGYGYQNSWGAALDARRLVRETLNLEPVPEGYTLKSLEEQALLQDDEKAEEQSPIPGLRPHL